MNEVADALAGPRPDCGGKSILEMIWDELMEAYGQCMMGPPMAGRKPLGDERAKQTGRALGLATAIAIIVNPYAPNVDAVRAEARARWEES